jgi:hypothetical protein
VGEGNELALNPFSVIPGRAEGVSPEPTSKLDACYPVMSCGLSLREPRNDGLVGAGDAEIDGFEERLLHRRLREQG